MQRQPGGESAPGTQVAVSYPEEEKVLRDAIGTFESKGLAAGVTLSEVGKLRVFALSANAFAVGPLTSDMGRFFYVYRLGGAKPGKTTVTRAASTPRWGTPDTGEDLLASAPGGAPLEVKPATPAAPSGGEDAGTSSDTGPQPKRAGPEIQPGNGTTAELREERERLVTERGWANFFDLSYTTSIKRLDLLIAERAYSNLDNAEVNLVFDGKALILAGAANGAWNAVSGKKTGAGEFDYSPARQRVKDEGPIPSGTYWLDPSQLVELSDRWFYAARYESGWGTHRITIHPFGDTRTFGRGGFFIHGGETPGSAGCIDLTSEMASFAKQLAATPRGTRVKLTVKYANGP